VTAAVLLPNSAGEEDYFISHAGIADNPGISALELAAIRRQFANNPSQLAAREHGLFVKPEGLVLKVFDRVKHVTHDYPLEQCRELLKRCYLFAGLDPGKLRWAFTLWASTPERKVLLVDEIFSQYGTLDHRAQLIAALMTMYGIQRRNFPIFADCANPTDIGEINEAFMRLRGSEDFAHAAEIRAQAVGMDKKLIKPGVERVESLITRDLLLVRKESGEGMEWKLGWNSESEGLPQIGSRWLYEIGNWQWTKPDRLMEKAQKEVPDDNTADGADMMASTRYAIMSVIKKGKELEGEDRSAFSPSALKEDFESTMKVGNRLKRGRNRQQEEIDRAMRDY
jgi:hypothetical protein